MNVIVFARRLEVGGSQLNAVDLATGLRERHSLEVILFATPVGVPMMVSAMMAKEAR